MNENIINHKIHKRKVDSAAQNNQTERCNDPKSQKIRKIPQIEIEMKMIFIFRTDVCDNLSGTDMIDIKRSSHKFKEDIYSKIYQFIKYF